MKLHLLLALLWLLSGRTAAQCETDVLENSDAVSDDGFGTAVALSGDTAFVSALGLATTVEKVYVFERGPGGWTEVQRLVASSGQLSDLFGWALDVDGDRAVVGAGFDDDMGTDAGAAYVFEKVASTWVEVAKLTASDGIPNQRFGRSVAIEGDRIVVGAPSSLDTPLQTGWAYVYERGANGWAEVQKLVASDASGSDFFGESVDLSGDVIVAGARLDWNAIGPYAGSAYVFERVANTFVETQKLIGSQLTSHDQFGNAVAVDGDRILAGAWHQSGPDAQSGVVYVFEKTGNTWPETAILTASESWEWFRFGETVDLQGDTAIISPDSHHAAYVFEHGPSGWTQEGKLRSVPWPTGSLFGWSVAFDGSTVLVSEPAYPLVGGFGTVSVFGLPGFATHYCRCDDGSFCPYAAAGCENSTGRGAELTACGSASVAADDLLLTVWDVPFGQVGLILMGGAQTQVPFGDGELCVAPGTAGVFRFPAHPTDGHFVEGPGMVAHSIANFGAAGAIQSGDTWYFQAWYRDPVGYFCGLGLQQVPSGFSVTNALSVTFAP